MKIPGLIHPRATFAWVALIAMLGLAACGDDGTAVGDRLDTTLGTNGKVTTAIGGQDFATAVAIQSDGKIVVAGYSSTITDYDFSLARYNADGSLDMTFDTDGKVTTDIGGNADIAMAMAIQSDGKIVVAGSSSINANNDSFVVALARYNADGSLDTTFDTDGKVTTAIGAGNNFASAVAIQSDGKIVVAGSSWNGANYDFALARYNTNGSLDTSFDTDGKVTTAIGTACGASAVAIQSDGKIVVAGYSLNGANDDFALARYNTDGSLDTTFDTDGKVTTAIGASYDYASAMAIQSNGKIVVAGSALINYTDDFALARYNADGSLDTTFQIAGKATTAIRSDDSAHAVAIQSDGKIVVVGETWGGSPSNSDFALVRYLP